MVDETRHEKSAKDKNGIQSERSNKNRNEVSRNNKHFSSMIVLYGWHPVVEALSNTKRDVRRLIATENSAARLVDKFGDSLRVAPEIVRPSEITRLLGPEAVHQGLYLEAEPLAVPELDGFPDRTILLALDQITDPHNVGAIVRSAAAFGVTGIVTTIRHAPGVSGVLAKSASGGLEHVPFVNVRNLAEALITLGEQGFLRIGLDSDAAEDLAKVEVSRPLIVVLGAEGKGLRERTRKCCDMLVKIPFSGPIRSLNVSNAAAIALYALTRSLDPGDGDTGQAAHVDTPST